MNSFGKYCLLYDEQYVILETYFIESMVVHLAPLNVYNMRELLLHITFYMLLIFFFLNTKCILLSQTKQYELYKVVFCLLKM